MTHQMTIEEAIDSLSEQALQCRDFSHSWTHHEAWKYSWGYERILKCLNCGTERTDPLDRRGGLIENGRRYKYPDGYQIKGLGHLGGERKDAIRLESVLRSKPRDVVLVEDD